MSFTSADFLFFLALAATLFRLVPRSWRAAYILIASYLFYCTTSPRGAVALALATGTTFYAAQFCERLRGKPIGKVVLCGAILLLASYLLFFKLIVLLPHQQVSSWIMPLGISYYSFKLISYVLDVHWGKLKAQTQLVPFAAYVAFFPQIVAGPIERSEDFLNQLGRPGKIISGVTRLAWGLTKKLVIADHLAPAVNFVFGHTTSLHGAWWIGFYLWPLQLYADFSGLTDIAIGTGRLFGIEGPENFNRPFTATTISDYWRRWHMSLTNWLGDYVFTPLRMATRAAGNFGLVASITINMIAIGLWHGFSWGYFVFGVLHAVFLSADALTTRSRKAWSKTHAEWSAARNWFGWLLTFHLVALALVFFRANTVPDAWYLVRHTWSGITNLSEVLQPFGPNTARVFGVGLVSYGLLELCERFRPDRWLAEMRISGPRYLRWSLYVSALLVFVAGFALLLADSGGPRNPFVYAVF